MEPGRSSLMIAFQGDVQAQVMLGAVNLVLRGRWRECETQVLIAGAYPGNLPTTLRQVSVIETHTATTAGRSLRLRSAQIELDIQARSVQVHRDLGAALFAAVPHAAVPLRIRAGWVLLLSALRIPAVARLIMPRRTSP